jgi:signal transduction histidine kinase/DNA-binding response OmpR family regulator
MTSTSHPHHSNTTQPLPSGSELAIRLYSTVIVDPHDDLRQLFAGIAAARGHEVNTFPTPSSALAHCKKETVDHLVVRLDAETASEVLPLLRELTASANGPRVHVLATTGHHQPLEHVEAWLSAGVDEFLILTSDVDREFTLKMMEAEHYARRHGRGAPAPPVASPTSAPGSSYVLFDSSPTAQFLLGEEEQSILHLNPAAEKLLGPTRAAVADKYLPLQFPEIFDAPAFSLAGSEFAIPELELRPLPDRPAILLSAKGKRVPWQAGHAWLVELRPRAQEKRLEHEALQAARVDASIMTLRGLAREISDALTSLRGNLDLLSRQPFPRQESKDYLEDAQHGLRRIEGFARKAASLTRLRDSAVLQPQRLHLKSLLEKSIAFALLDGHCVPVLEIPADAWPVQGDPQLLNEAFLQLGRNASRSMPPGGHLHVSVANVLAKPDSAAPASIEILLRDEGHGIPSEDLSRVTDPYFSTWGREGLGLTTAAAIIRAHGGSLEINSRLTEGTTVRVQLPVHVKQLLEAELASDTNEPATQPAPSKGPQRILIMDDDPQIRSLVQKILLSQGYAVYCTNDGEEAIQSYRKAHQFGAPFDLILMDLDVRGGMGGVEATQILRKEFPHLKAVLATGYVDNSLLASHQDHGFLGVLLKPFEVERLVGLVGKLV